MLATQANHVIHDGKLTKGCFIRLKNYQANEVKGKRILIILDIDVIESLGTMEKIGETDCGETRVTNKSDIRTWHKPNSEGKLFSVNLLDESGEIKATGFNEQCDALYDIFQEGSVYYITSPCRVQIAKKQFSNINNDYELTFERDTLVEKAEDQENVPQVRYNFSNIGDLQTIEKDSTVDLIAVLKEVGATSEIISKTTNKPYSKRELTLVDDTGYSVQLTIWGKTAISFDASPESVVAFKGVKVSDFGGRSLSLLSSGSMSFDPYIQEAHKLKGWYDSQGRTEKFASHSNMASAGAAGGRQDPLKTVEQVNRKVLECRKVQITFQLEPRLSISNKTISATPPVSTKLAPAYRYILSLNVNDHTGQFWLTAFDDVGRLVVGKSADEMMELKENDQAAMEKAFDDANCKMMTFKCRAKTDTFQEQSRIRYQVIQASAVNYGADALKLAEMIKAYNID
ncbi:hypothetical protein DID88_001846 [Monilinia fructigena]|uniref:Replication factor A protein 1 n=1 Tax=Monilinia fructigena TaxID=38457 RepID=A0A395IVQ0_9HELO|nr:hypothetical protein DID88_001846 [Monilinia fructigena]